MRKPRDSAAAWLSVLLMACGTGTTVPPAAPIVFDTTAWETDLATWREVRSTWVAGPFGPLAQVAVCRSSASAVPIALTAAGAAGCRVPTVSGRDTLGMIRTRGDTATLTDAPGAFWVGARALRTARVLGLDSRPEIDGALAWLGPLQVSARWADGMITAWILDTTAAARATFAGIEWWPADPAWRVPARFDPGDLGWAQIPTVRGYELPRQIVGSLELEVGGIPYRLTAFGKGRGARSMMVVIRDGTTGAGSYPSGRFVDVPLPDSTGWTVVDFNLARNPDCAFTVTSPCPLPPPENHIAARLEAGERTYRSP